MQEQKNSASILADRRIRINRIKKFIKWIIVLGITIPSIFSILLFFKISSLNNRIDMLENKWSIYIEQNKSVEETPLFELKEQTSDYINEESVDFIEQQQVIVLQKNRQVEDVLSSSTRKVYFTFDDGPSANTNKILDILQLYDIKATFFVVGKEEKDFLKVYKRIVEEGHTIGIHSYSHKYEEIYSSAENFLEDFWKESDFLYETTGIRPFCYRFPGGSSTTKMGSDFEVYRDCIESCDVQYYDWNISSQDASPVSLTKDQIIKNVTTEIANYETAIILFHDAYGKQTTVEALPEIIEYIQKMENTVILPISIGTEQIHQK